MTNSVDDYKNLVVLLEQALKFYANESNYSPAVPNGTTFSLIILDQGSQARFALDKIKDFNEMYQKIEDEYINKIIEETKDDDVFSENILNIVRQLKNTENNDIDI